MTKRWYVVQTRSNYEKRVRDSLTDAVALAGLQDAFEEIIVPTEEVVEMKDGKRRKSERKFFPGYVLLRAEMNEQVWHLVNSVSHVLGFVGGTSERPAPITDEEVSRILRRVEAGVNKPRPRTLFEVGEVVRVIDGPFKDFNGVVEEVNYEKGRLKVGVLIFGRTTTVELEFQQVEKERV